MKQDPQINVPRRGPIFALSLVFAACLLLYAEGAPLAQSIKDGCWTILQYDDAGNVTGTIESGACKKHSSRKLAKLTDPKQIPPRKLEYLLLAPEGSNLAVLDKVPVAVGAIEDFRSLGFIGVYMKLEDERDFARVKSQFVRAIPGAKFVPNDQYIAQASRSAWPDQPFAEKDLAKSCGAGLKIGMIDGYVDPKAVNLSGAKLASKSFHPEGSKRAKGDHGLIIAEMFVGQGAGDRIVGLVPSARLYAANIFGEQNGRVTSSLLGLIKAMRWMVANKVRFINIGFAGRYNEGLDFVMDRVAERGIVVIAPAGNFGREASPAWPAAHRDVIAVTAVDENRRPIKDGNAGNYIDVAAVGANLAIETSKGRKTVSGTSYATPFITTVTAFALRKTQTVSLKRLRRYYAQIATDLGGKGKDDRFGWGLVRYVPKCLKE